MERAMTRDNIGDVLRLLRISYDLTIKELSEKTNISKSYITEIEKGDKKPSEKIIKNYSIGLGIPEDTLNYLLTHYSQKQMSYQKLLIEILRKISKL